MKTRTQHLSIVRQASLKILGLCISAIVFLFLIPVRADGLNHPQIYDQKQSRETSPGKMAGSLLETLSDEAILEARTLLDRLGYWVNLDEREVDASLRHALTAFQKIEGRARTGVLTQEEIDALRNARQPRAIEVGYPHIEVDLSRQVLFIIACDGADLRVLPISSGSGELFTEGGVTRRAITPMGRFSVYRKIQGWRKSPLGLLYYPNYINEGVAIHGAPSVPPYPASHGCIRIPMFAAKQFSEIAAVGLPVFVYDEMTVERLDDHQ
jgi:N-acetylmuramoyl-L-alanine amidase